MIFLVIFMLNIFLKKEEKKKKKRKSVLFAGMKSGLKIWNFNNMKIQGSPQREGLNED